MSLFILRLWKIFSLCIVRWSPKVLYECCVSRVVCSRENVIKLRTVLCSCLACFLFFHLHKVWCHGYLKKEVYWRSVPWRWLGWRQAKKLIVLTKSKGPPKNEYHLVCNSESSYNESRFWLPRSGFYLWCVQRVFHFLNKLCVVFVLML